MRRPLAGLGGGRRRLGDGELRHRLGHDARLVGADWVARLIAAALADPEGKALDGALETIRSFTTAGTA